MGICLFPMNLGLYSLENRIQLSPNGVLPVLFVLFDSTAGKQQVEIRLWVWKGPQSSSHPRIFLKPSRLTIPTWLWLLTTHIVPCLNAAPSNLCPGGCPSFLVLMGTSVYFPSAKGRGGRETGTLRRAAAHLQFHQN